MEKYNYLEAVTKDAKEAILKNLKNWKFTDRLDLESIANLKLWADDNVTGNVSGCYCYSVEQAEEYLCHNWDLLELAIADLGFDDGAANIFEQGAMACDVTIRLHLLEFAIGDALDELEEEGKIIYNKAEDCAAEAAACRELCRRGY